MFRIVFSLLLLASVQPCFAKPNVLLILADDLGYADLGCQGSPCIPTPHLDRLAKEGIRCTQGYVTHPLCSPSRAGLLTGRQQQRFGHENNPFWNPKDANAGLPLTETTLADALQKEGYRTALFGKWHLGSHPHFHPLKRGFDECVAVLGGGHLYFPGKVSDKEYSLPLDRNGNPEPMKKYLTYQLGSETAAFIQRQAQDTKPWFAYLAFTAPHTPLEAPKLWLDKFAHMADQSLRTYAAMVAAMDSSIGEVLKALDDTQQADNTLIFFLSDNGGPNMRGQDGISVADNKPLRGYKGDLYEGGVRVPFLIRWPAQLKPGVHSHPVSALDIFPTALAASMAAGSESDGRDLLPQLQNPQQTPPPRTLAWRKNGKAGHHALRHGDLKLVRYNDRPIELYDLAKDSAETTNLAPTDPESVKEMERHLAEWEKGMIEPVFLGTNNAKEAALLKSGSK
jgi:arylsulfatase A-like enzyme